MTVFHSYASCQGWKGIGDCSFQAKTVQATRSNQYFKDPDWKKFPFSFLVEMNRFFLIVRLPTSVRVSLLKIFWRILTLEVCVEQLFC